MSKAVELAFRVSKPTAPIASSGGSLYIAHGLLGNAGNWDSTCRHLGRHPKLQSRLREMVAVDMRNHGRSPHVQDHSNAALASDLEHFVLKHPPADGGGGVLMGHSMGGLAAMGLLLRRWNEQALLPYHGGAGHSTRFGEWSAEACERCCESMRLVSPDPLRKRLFGEEGVTGAAPGLLRAAVIVDITPTVVLGTEANTDGSSVPEVLQAMARVDLSTVHSFSDASTALRAAGIKGQGMLDFVATNISIDSASRAASWRCNVDYLSQHYGSFSPDIVEWYRSYEDDDSKTLYCPQPCTLPVLFVFGSRSPYNIDKDRELLPLFFPNSQTLVVEGAGHFVHYEKMNEFVDAVAPFLADHL